MTSPSVSDDSITLDGAPLARGGRWRPASVLAGVALLAVAGVRLASGPDAAGRTAPVSWLEPCSVTGVSGPVWCGSYAVWENRATRRGRRIELRVVVLGATGRPRRADPVVHLQGGPGGAATEAIAGVLAVLEPLRSGRDLVFVDQRGTGRSHPLDCPQPASDAPLQEYFEELLPPAEVRACLAVQDADVSQYTTPIAMDDLDEVLRALGYPQVNLYGISYGTRAALVYLKRHPESVRSLMLKGVAPLDMLNPLPFSRALDRVIEATLSACRAQPPCRRRYPELHAEWRQVRARLEAGPVTAELEHPVTGRAERVSITRGVFADGLRHLLYSVHGAAWLPYLIHAAAAGDFEPFARLELRQAVGFGESLSDGVFLTVTCSEDLRFVDLQEIERQTAGTFLGEYRVRRQLAACTAWPSGSGVEEGYREPVRSRVPALLISGELDPATPPEGGRRVAQELANALHLIVPNQSHGFANTACERRIMTEFVERGSAVALDTGCVAETTRPPFR